MQAQFQPSSFIPKEPISTTPSVRRQKKPGNILLVIAIFVFVASLATAVGAFFYERYMESSLASAQDRLDTLQDSLEREVLEELINLDQRLAMSQELLANHTALTNFFEELERSTLRSVRFTSLAVSKNQVEDGFMLTLKGRTDSYPSVALQSDAFGQSDMFREPIVSDFGLSEEGEVLFSVSALLDPALITYAQSIQE